MIRYLTLTATLLCCMAAGAQAAGKDPCAKAKLKESQRAWLKFRDASFELVSEVNSDPGTYSEIVYNDFKANFVERRVKELRDVFHGPGGYDDMPAWLK